MKKHRMIFLTAAMIIEFAAVIMITKAYFTDSSQTSGLIFLTIGLLFFVIGIIRKEESRKWRSN